MLALTPFFKNYFKVFFNSEEIGLENRHNLFFLPLSLLAEGHNSHVFKLYQCQGVY